MSNPISLIRRAPKRFTAAVLMVAAAIIIPSAVFAWGPSRPTYTMANPAPHVTFNSITDHPQVGDERNFLRIRETGTSTYGDNVNLEPGKVYEVSVFYHNNASASLNASGKGVAHDAKVKVEMPGVVNAGVNAAFTSTISASNATPGSVWDEAYGKNATNGQVALRYVSGSAKFVSNGAVNGQALPDTLFTTGANLGYNAQDGKLPGCDEFSGFVNFQIRVDQPNFDLKKQVSVDAGKTWVDDKATAKAGDTVQYRVVYQNTGTTQQDNVSLRDILPNGVTYVAGSSLMANATTGGQYKAALDGITTTGTNVGSYQPKGNVYFKFSAKLPSEDKLKCGENTLVNTARATTNAGYKEDTATVTIVKKCAPPVVPKDITVCELKTKKIITIKENEFDSSKHSKNLDDCKVTPVKDIKVCELKTKKIITIKETAFDASKHSKNLDDCKEKPVVPPVTPPVTPPTPTTPAELPQTGAGDVVSIVGLGALIASIAYYAASRRALGL